MTHNVAHPSSTPLGRARDKLRASFKPAAQKPADFEDYWERTLVELAALPLAPEEEVIPIRSTEFATTYGVKLTSLGPYRIFAYYSVPHGEGPFPAMIHAPDYGSVVAVPPYEERKHFVTLAPCARGQRLSDKPFAASYPGLLTVEIDRPETYVYRGIVADVCRAVDYLLSRSEVDVSQMTIVGSDLALIAAALRPQIGAVILDFVRSTPIFYAVQDRIPQTEAYPLEEINDYLRLYPEKTDAVYNTLAYFDLLFFAPKVQASVLLFYGPEGSPFSRTVAQPLIDILGGQVKGVESSGSRYVERLERETWLRERWG